MTFTWWAPKSFFIIFLWAKRKLLWRSILMQIFLLGKVFKRVFKFAFILALEPNKLVPSKFTVNEVRNIQKRWKNFIKYMYNFPVTKHWYNFFVSDLLFEDIKLDYYIDFCYLIPTFTSYLYCWCLMTVFVMF